MFCLCKLPILRRHLEARGWGEGEFLLLIDIQGPVASHREKKNKSSRAFARVIKCPGQAVIHINTPPNHLAIE